MSGDGTVPGGRLARPVILAATALALAAPPALAAGCGTPRASAESESESRALASGPVAATALALMPLREAEAVLRADPLRSDTALRARWLELIRRYGEVAATGRSADQRMEPLVRAAALSADLHRISRAAPDLDEALRLYQAAADLDAAHPLAAAACLRAALLRLEHGGGAGRTTGARALAACAEKHADRPEAAEAERLLAMLRALVPAAAGVAGTPVVGPSGIPGEVVDSARLAIPRVAAAAIVRDVHRVAAPSYTRLVIQLDRPAHFSAGEAAGGGGKPPRLYVDVHDARLAPELPEALPSGDGLLRAARTAMFNPTTARVVLDLDAVKRFRVFPLDEPFRIVVDLFGESDEGPAAPLAGHPAVAGLERALGTSSAAALGLKVRKIVLDPGHGGDDTGALAAGGLAEKDVNLAVALALAPLLRARLGVEVALTRDADVAVPLERRAALANAARGDLLVSIHCNSAADAAARGVEVYYLDIASDEYARRAADRENARTAKGLGDLSSVLSDLVTRVNAEESHALAGALHASILGRLDAAHRDAVDRGVRGALFWVLLGARMPSALVEMSFLSNPVDAARLGTEDYRALLAAGIADGLAAFIASRGL